MEIGIERKRPLVLRARIGEAPLLAVDQAELLERDRMSGAERDGSFEARGRVREAARAGVRDAEIDVRVRKLRLLLRHGFELGDAALVQPLLEIADRGQVALAKLRAHARRVGDREAGARKHLEPDRRPFLRRRTRAAALGLGGRSDGVDGRGARLARATGT